MRASITEKRKESKRKLSLNFEGGFDRGEEEKERENGVLFTVNLVNFTVPVKFLCAEYHKLGIISRAGVWICHKAA